MDKRWYPAALTAVLVGCGGSADNSGGGTGGVDAGSPMATGSRPNSFYGPKLATGGSNAGVDSGVPSATGGMAMIM